MSSFTFSDVLLEPQYSEVRSRTTVDTSSSLLRRDGKDTDNKSFSSIDLKLPIISANMADITGPKMAITMAKHGGMGILHRFCSVSDAVKQFRESRNGITEFTKLLDQQAAYKVGVSVGIKGEDINRFNCLYEAGARVFCIDIAHGHCIMMKEMIAMIRMIEKEKNLGEVIIIAGNVATPDGAFDLCVWGADIIKVGIGPGRACYTRANAGVGVPQLSALHNIKNAYPQIQLISDGGIKESGDIVKALKYADAVMVGSFISGTSETPGHVYQNEKNEFYKTYSGSASAENKVKSGNDNSFVEGKMITVPFRGKVGYILNKASEGIKSGFSYSGAKNLLEFRKKSKFIFLSGGSKSESKI